MERPVQRARRAGHLHALAADHERGVQHLRRAGGPQRAEGVLEQAGGGRPCRTWDQTTAFRCFPMLHGRETGKLKTSHWYAHHGSSYRDRGQRKIGHARGVAGAFAPRKITGHTRGSATQTMRRPESCVTKTSPCASRCFRTNASGFDPNAIALPRCGSHDQTTGGSPALRRFW